MANKYIIQRRTASGLETVAEIPALEGNKVDMSWLPVVGAMGSAIIERGDNANGEYIRWADGTQICWHQVVEQNIALSPGARVIKQLVLPIGVVLNDVLVYGAAEHSLAPVWCGQSHVYNDTQVELDIFTQVQTEVGTLTYGYMCISRWK